MQRRMQILKLGFSLLELIVVIVIIGIIAAIAIPRMSRGTAGAVESALAGDLAVLRNAIDLFAAEHDGKLPKLALIEGQLTMYTDSSNTTAPVGTKDTTRIYGPYVRKIPPAPVGPYRGNTAFTGTLPLGTEPKGWYYNESTGDIRLNCPDSEKDESGKAYNQY